MKDYEHEGITIHWNPEICTHSGNCARGLSQVFRPKERPWVQPENATAGEIQQTIDRCPSRALTYTLK